jgi:RNA polymerase sigma-70 factor (ECF subfamily)
MDKVYNEKEAIRLLAAGNVTGFQQIYERYAFAVARVGFRFFRSAELTEDLVQDVFTSVWINREKFANVESVEAYLVRMCTNKAKDHLRAYSIRKLGEIEYASTKRYDRNTVEDHVLDKECLALMQKALDKLPATQKQVYELVTSEGLTHKEVAAQLGCSEKTVSNSMTLTLQSVKTSLGQLIAILISLSAI